MMKAPLIELEQARPNDGIRPHMRNGAVRLLRPALKWWFIHERARVSRRLVLNSHFVLKRKFRRPQPPLPVAHPTLRRSDEVRPSSSEASLLLRHSKRPWSTKSGVMTRHENHADEWDASGKSEPSLARRPHRLAALQSSAHVAPSRPKPRPPDSQALRQTTVRGAVELQRTRRAQAAHATLVRTCPRSGSMHRTLRDSAAMPPRSSRPCWWD